MSNESYRSNNLPNQIQADIDAANARAEQSERNYRFARFVTRSYVAVALLIGLFFGAVGHAVRMKLAADEQADADSQQQANIVATTPVVEPAPMRECLDGASRVCPSGNVLSDMIEPSFKTCRNGNWGPCTYTAQQAIQIHIPLPRSGTAGYVEVSLYDCVTNKEDGGNGNPPPHSARSFYVVSRSAEGTEVLTSCPGASIQQLNAHLRALDARARRIETATHQTWTVEVSGAQP